MKKKMTISDFSRPGEQLAVINPADLMPLPAPYDKFDKPIKALSAEQRKRMDASLDGISILGLAPPASPEEERAFIEKFLAGLAKLFTSEDNWTFLQPLVHSLE